MINENKDYETTSSSPKKDISEIDISKVKFARDWVFWENYQLKDNNPSNWEDSMKEVVEFSDLITFWQFWNNYPGSNPKNFVFDGEKLVYFFENKKRIDGLNLFVKGVVPKWEDSQNSGGRCLQLLYDVKIDLHEFLDVIGENWLKLVLMLIGESLPSSKHINGIRFIDKCKLKQKLLYRIEIWINPSINSEEAEKNNELENLKSFLTSNFGSEIDDKPIECKK